MHFALHCLGLLALLCATNAYADALDLTGDLKLRLVNNRHPDNSLLRDLIGEDATEYSGSARFNLKLDQGKWSAETSYQISAINSDNLGTETAPGPVFNTPLLPDDDQQLFDLTSTINDSGDSAVVHRLDRLLVGYQGARNVIKFGRQAISWGNGLVYTPMDFFNPFDPAAIDTEYKPGDDMLYLQHLLQNGDDLQLVWVTRRNEAGHTSSDVNSIAAKYHGFAGNHEFDLLASEHFSDTIVAVGGVFSIGGAIARGDWVYTDTDNDDASSLVANLSYSWTAWDKNVTGSIEYFRNGFGIDDGDYRPAALQERPALLARIDRGELFTLGRDYLAGSLVVEMAPLWWLTPNVFYNLSDESALVQIISQHDLTQNTQLVAALSLPMGPDGTEFGGISAGEPVVEGGERYLSSDWSIYAQLAWYF